MSGRQKEWGGWHVPLGSPGGVAPLLGLQIRPTTTQATMRSLGTTLRRMEGAVKRRAQRSAGYPRGISRWHMVSRVQKGAVVGPEGTIELRVPELSPGQRVRVTIEIEPATVERQRAIDMLAARPKKSSSPSRR